MRTGSPPVWRSSVVRINGDGDVMVSSRAVARSILPHELSRSPQLISDKRLPPASGAALGNRRPSELFDGPAVHTRHRGAFEMSRGFPSMTALLGLLAIAGYQNRDKLAEMLGGSSNPGGAGGQAGGMPQQGGLSQQGGLGGLLGNLGGAGSAGVGGLLGGGLSELLERFQQNGHGEAAQSWVGT